MELALSILLAITAFAAVAAWARRNDERARAQRLSDEVAALRKAAAGARMTDGDTGSTPSVGSAGLSDEEPQEADADPREQELERLLARADEALASATHARSGSSALPLEVLRQEALELLALLERVEASFSPLAERCGLLLTGHQAPPLAPPPDPPPPFETRPVSAGLRTAEDLTDTAARLRDDIGGLVRSTNRLGEATAASSEALAAVARGAEAIAPMSGALSAVANRVNLLALNLGVLVTPGAAAANVEEAGAELRSIFEEARRLSREVGTIGQRVASSAHAAEERGAELAGTIAEERARVERGLSGLGALDELAENLRRAFEAVRRAGRDSEETSSRLHALVAELLAQAGTFAAEVAEDRRAAGAFTGEFLGAVASVTEARIAADRAIRNLLAVAESSAERRTPGPDAAALGAIRDARRLLA